MSQIITKGIANNAVTAPKMRIANNVFIPMRNAANSADINSIKINASDAIEFGAAMNFGGFNARNVVNLQDSTAVNALNIQDRELFDTAGAQSLNWANPGQIVLFKNLELNADDAFNIGSGASRLSVAYTRAISATGVLTLNGGSQGDIDAGTNKITNVVDPTSAQDVATKSYVDSSSGGGAPTLVATAVGFDVTVANPGTDTWDGVTLSTGDELILFGQAAPEENGVYVFDTTSTPLVRSTSWNAAGEFTVGRMVSVDGANFGGEQYGSAVFILADAVATLGTDPVNFYMTAAKVNVQPVNQWLRWFDDTATAVNVLRVNDNPALQLGNSALAFQLESLSASINSDGDININSQQKIVLSTVTNTIEIVGDNTTAPSLNFYDDDGSNFFGIKAAGTTVADVTYTWPDDAPATSGFVLSSTTAGVMSWVPAGGGSTGNKETFTLSSGDITNQYIDLANVAAVGTIHFIVKGLGPTLEGASYDYDVNYIGGAGGNTRITFLNDLATGGGSALVATDVVQVAYLV